MSAENSTLVIIPVYNELISLYQLVPRLLAQPIDILFIDGASRDSTDLAIQQTITKYPGRIMAIFQKERNGLGKAYLEGFAAVLGISPGVPCSYKYIFEMDADLSHAPERIPEFIDLLERGVASVVVGSRYLGGNSVVGWPLSRLLLSRGAALYARFFTGLPVKDPTSGFKGYRREVIECAYPLLLEKCLSGYAFQVQILFYAWKLGFRIKEIPIIFKEREYGVSKMNRSIVREALINIPLLRMRGKDGKA